MCFRAGFGSVGCQLSLSVAYFSTCKGSAVRGMGESFSIMSLSRAFWGPSCTRALFNSWGGLSLALVGPRGCPECGDKPELGGDDLSPE